MRTAFKIILAVLAILCAAPTPAYADDDPAELFESIDRSLQRANQLLRSKKNDEAQAALDDATESLASLRKIALPDDLRAEVEGLQKRLTTAERTLAKRKGTGSKAAATARSKTKEASPARTAAKNGATNRTSAPNQDKPPAPKFSTDVAPILIARCGNCHINAASGGLSMANFAALARGSRDGPIITPGASDASRLVEVIFTGKMPRGGGQVSPEELAMISLWINAGARFDGTDPTAPLGQQPAMAPANDPSAAKTEDVLFVRDLAPAIVASCLDCHKNDQPAGELRLTSFASLIEGGASGKVVEPGRPRDSLLVKRLRGLDGTRMPKDKASLSSDVIARFEAWIKQGAPTGGIDTAMPLSLAIERYEAAQLTHEELTAKRRASAEKMWTRAFPDAPAKVQQTANFLVFGNVSADRRTQVAKLAETELTKIGKLLKLASDAPLVKGALVLFAFGSAQDYDDFVRAVEEREPSEGVNGHARAQGADLYACLVVKGESGETLPALVAEQVADGFLLTLSNVPPWFAAGAARTIATRVEPKSPLVKKWNTEIQALSPVANAEQLLSDSTLDRESIAHRYALVQSLTRKLPQFQALVAAFAQDQDFDAALTEAYRHDGRELAELWSRRKPAAK
ncbi:MAG TPA: c-type cytochrome domain-containing protein [Pirellulales bacterium]|nr:c-type cytochrome domain-containing protein [Pirellulales bacterium]